MPKKAELAEEITTQPILEKPKLLLGLRQTAIIEIIIFFVVVLTIDVVFFDSNRFIDVYPHPFWLIVMMISVQYGTSEGLVAAVISGFILLVMNLPEQDINQDLHTYLFEISLRPILWFSIAILVGELSFRHIKERDLLRDELRGAKFREEILSNSYKKLNQLKQNLEIKVAGQLRTVISTYEAARTIEKLDPALVLFGVSDMVNAMMGPEKFSLFTLSNNGLQAGIQRGWDRKEPLSRMFKTDTLLFQEVVAQRRILCVVSAEDENILKGEGIIAGPILSEDSQEVIGMLKIEKLGFMELTLSTVENFKILCQWIGTVYTNARRFKDAQSHSLLTEDGKLLSHEFFTRQTEFLIKLAQRFNFDISMLVIRLDNYKKLPHEVVEQFIDILNESIHEALRTTDLAFNHQSRKWECAIVLPYTSLDEAENVLEKLKVSLTSRIDEDESVLKYVTTTQALYRANAKIERIKPALDKKEYEVVDAKNDVVATK